MKRVHESVDYVKHRDAKQLFNLTEEVGKMGIVSEEALLGGVHTVKIPSYRINKGSGSSKFTIYTVEAYAGASAWHVARRYSEFKNMHDDLVASGIRGMPALPPKRVFNSFTKDFLDQRRNDLEVYVRSLLNIPACFQHPTFQYFFLHGRTIIMEAPTPSHKLSSSGINEFDDEIITDSRDIQHQETLQHIDEMADILDVGDESGFYSPMSNPRDDESLERRSTDNSSNEDSMFRTENVHSLQADHHLETQMSNHNGAGANANTSPIAAPPPLFKPEHLGRPPVHPQSMRPPVPAQNGTAAVGGDKGEYKPRLEDFDFIRVLGQGSFGKVTLCRKKDTGQFFAMKALKKFHIIRRKQVAHTKTERSVLGQVSHPFIVRLHYAFQSSDKLYFVLDYCSGGELFFHLGRVGRFQESLGRFYAAEIALALGCLHSMEVVYRDLKPENILLDADGHIKIADFGLSKEGIADAVRGTHSFCGTPEYLAPEVINRTGHGSAVDWWSLGALLYEMLTGLPPWYSQDRHRMFASIRSSELRFPDYLSPLARQILGDFLQRDVTARLGSNRDIEEVKEHPFFEQIAFDALYRKEVTPPFIPRVTSQTDTTNFDVSFTRLPVNSIDAQNVSASPQPPLHISTSMSEEPLFAGFTFTEPSNLMQHMRNHGKKFTPTSPTNLSSSLMFE